MKRQLNMYLLALLVMFIITYQLKYTIAQNMDITWQQCFGGSECDIAKDIILTENTYLILGTTKSIDGDISYNHGLTDIWLINIDSLGNILWEKTIGGSSGENSIRLLPVSDTIFYIVGGSGSTDGDISHNPYPGSSNFWITKVNITGEIIWDKMMGGTRLEDIRNGLITNDGGVVAIGLTTSNDGDISMFHGFWDIWIVKVNAAGEKEWDFTLGGTLMEEAGAIIQTCDGGYLVAASSDGKGGGNFDCDDYHGTPGSYADAWLIKLDSLRNIEWQHCYGGQYHDNAFGLLGLEDGYVFTGYTESNDGDVSGLHGIPGDPLGTDIWVVRIDTIGNILWQKCLGGSKGEHARNIFQTEDSGFMVIGQTKSNDGDVVGFHGVAGYNYDIWMVKLSNLGELEWQKCLGGDGEEEIYHGVVKKDDYDYVIAGSSDYPSGDVICNFHVWDDYWVFEINDSTSGIGISYPDKAEINVYPNPANDYVVFEIPPSISPNEGKNRILINDVFGQLVATLSIKNQKSKIENQKLIWDSREVKPGVYFFRYKMNGVLGSGKIVISK